MKCVSNFDEHCMVYLCINQLNLQALAGREPQGPGAGEIRNPELVKAQQSHQNSKERYPTQDILKKNIQYPLGNDHISHLGRRSVIVPRKVLDTQMDTQASNRCFMAISKNLLFALR